MAVVEYKNKSYVQSGDMFICKLLTDQYIVMYYRCAYLDNENNIDDKLLIFNFENHYSKDNIFIKCGRCSVEKAQVIKEIKNKWTCDTEVEFVSNDNLLITVSKKA